MNPSRRKSCSTIWRSLFILVPAILVLGTQAWGAEARLPANRTYLGFVQGLEDDNPFDGAFSCLVFTGDGELVAGDDTGEWAINDALSVSGHQRAISFEISVEDDGGGEVQIDALCWLDGMGATNTIACAAHARGAGILVNFGLTARPLGGGTSAAALSRCQTQADSLNN